MSKQNEKNNIKAIEETLSELKETIKNLKKEFAISNEKLNLHINRKFSDVKVLNKTNEWEDYSGKFYLTNEETDDMLYKKALKHYNTYFKNNSDWHRNKHLGIFITSFKDGKVIKKQMITDKYKEKE